MASQGASAAAGQGHDPDAQEPLAAALRRTAWGAALDARELAVVEQGVFSRSFRAGALVAPRGEVPAHWLGVLSGMVKVDSSSADGRGTSFIGVAAGGWLGEGALLKREPRPYAVVAMHDTRVAYMTAATFAWLYEHSLAFNHFLVTQLNARLGQFIAMLERARMHATPELVALGLASLLETREGDARVCISQEELGRLCGVSRQLVARELRKLQEDGLISVAYSEIRVRDLGGLRSAAGL